MEGIKNSRIYSLTCKLILGVNNHALAYLSPTGGGWGWCFAFSFEKKYVVLNLLITTKKSKP